MSTNPINTAAAAAGGAQPAPADPGMAALSPGEVVPAVEADFVIADSIADDDVAAPAPAIAPSGEPAAMADETSAGATPPDAPTVEQQAAPAADASASPTPEPDTAAASDAAPIPDTSPAPAAATAQMDAAEVEADADAAQQPAPEPGLAAAPAVAPQADAGVATTPAADEAAQDAAPAAVADVEGADAPAETSSKDTSEDEDADHLDDTAPLSRKDRLLARLTHKRTLIIAGAAITPVIIGAIAYLLIGHAPAPAHDAAPHADATSAATPIKPITPAATVQDEHAPADAGATQTATTAPSPSIPTNDHAAATPPAIPAHGATPVDAHAATPVLAAAPAAPTMEQQAAELAATQKLLAEERAKRLAAERRIDSLRVAEGPQPAFAREKSPRGEGKGNGKPGGRRLEDCNIERGSFAATLKACIDEFNRMPQSR